MGRGSKLTFFQRRHPDSLASGGQNTGDSASASVFPMPIQNCFPAGWTGWISFLSKGLKSLLPHHSSKASSL